MNLDYATVFSLAPYINENVITIIGICLVIGAMAKSSQVGLHVWLPMAMEGPTPVSALIHAATMVTAGVYLLMRSSPLIEYSSIVLLICLWLGAITTVFSSLVGLFQQDIKKVIAYSTMSQLGMMVIAIGLSSYNLALFHLVNHAFYKALLFLGAGAVIHAVADNQDFRRYGGLISFLPLTYSVILIASLSLVAFPFMTGFYSKDFILESAFGQYQFSSIAVYLIATIGAIFTTLYSVKVLYLTFLSPALGPKTSYDNAHEGDIFMMLPLIVLAVFSIFFGFLTKDIFLGLGSSFFIDNSIFIHPSNELVINTEFSVPIFFKLLPLFFTVFFSLFAIFISEIYPQSVISFKFNKIGTTIFGFFNQRFLVESVYNNILIKRVLVIGGLTTRLIDKGIVEFLGPLHLEISFLLFSKGLNKFNISLLTIYALYLLIFFISFVFIIYVCDINSSLTILLIFLTFFTLYRKDDNLKYSSHDPVFPRSVLQKNGIPLKLIIYIFMGLPVLFFLCIKAPFILGKACLPFWWFTILFYPINACCNSISAFVVYHLKYSEIISRDKLLKVFLLSIVFPIIFFNLFISIAEAQSPEPDLELERIRFEHLRTKGIVEGKIEEMLKYHEENKNHRHWNVARPLYIGRNYLNFSSEELTFLVGNSKGKAKILTAQNIEQNHVLGMPLKQEYDAFRVGDLVRVIRRKDGRVECIAVGRTIQALGFLANWKRNYV